MSDERSIKDAYERIAKLYATAAYKPFSIVFDEGHKKPAEGSEGFGWDTGRLDLPDPDIEALPTMASEQASPKHEEPDWSMLMARYDDDLVALALMDLVSQLLLEAKKLTDQRDHWRRSYAGAVRQDMRWAEWRDRVMSIHDAQIRELNRKIADMTMQIASYKDLVEEAAIRTGKWKRPPIEDRPPTPKNARFTKGRISGRS